MRHSSAGTEKDGRGGAYDVRRMGGAGCMGGVRVPVWERGGDFFFFFFFSFFFLSSINTKVRGACTIKIVNNNSKALLSEATLLVANNELLHSYYLKSAMIPRAT